MAPKKRKADYEGESEDDQPVEEQEEQEDDDALFDEDAPEPPPAAKKPKQLAVPAGGGKMAAVAMMRAQAEAAAANDDDDDDDDGPVRRGGGGDSDDDDDPGSDGSLNSTLSAGEQAKVAQMNELEREMYLFEREENLTRRRELRAYKLAAKQGKKQGSAAKAAAERAARARGAGTAAAGARAALQQLSAARRDKEARKQQAAERRRASAGGLEDDDYAGGAGGDGDDDDDDDEKAARRAAAKPRRRAEEDEDDEDDGRGYAATDSDDADDGRAGAAGPGAEDAEDAEDAALLVPQEDDAEQATPDDVRALQLARRVLAAWADHPLFVATVPGFVVRVAFGDRLDPALGRRVTRYLLVRVAAVVDLPQKPAYRFGGDPPPRRGADGRPLPPRPSDVAALQSLPITAAVLPPGSKAPVAETTRHLLLEERGTQVVLPMTQVSDQPATDEEIDRYVRWARGALVGQGLDPALVMQARAAAGGAAAGAGGGGGGGGGGGKRGRGRGAGGSVSASVPKAALEAASKAPRVAPPKPAVLSAILRVLPGGGGGPDGSSSGAAVVSGDEAEAAGAPLPPYVDAPVCPFVRRDRRLGERRLRRLMAYRLTSGDVKRMLEDKRRRGRLAANLAAERAKAAFALEAAESNLADCAERLLARRRAEAAAGRRGPALGDEGEDEEDLARAEEDARRAVGEAREMLAALDGRAAAAAAAAGGGGGEGGGADGAGAAKAGSNDMAAISARNKALNFKKALDGASNVPGAPAIAGVAAGAGAAAAGGGGARAGAAAGAPSSTDAFARRQTKSSVYWNTRGTAAKKADGKQNDGGANGGGDKKAADASAAAAAAAQKQKEEQEAEAELLMLRTSSAALGATATLDPRLAALDPAHLLDELELGVDDAALAGALGRLGLPGPGGAAGAGGAAAAAAEAVLVPRRVLGPGWTGPARDPLPEDKRVLTFAEWRERWLASQAKEAA